MTVLNIYVRHGVFKCHHGNSNYWTTPTPFSKFFKLFDVHIADALPGNVNKHPLIQLHSPVSWGLRINFTVFLGINLQILKLFYYRNVNTDSERGNLMARTFGYRKQSVIGFGNVRRLPDNCGEGPQNACYV